MVEGPRDCGNASEPSQEDGQLYIFLELQHFLREIGIVKVPTNIEKCLELLNNIPNTTVEQKQLIHDM